MGKVFEKFETEVKRGVLQLGVLCLWIKNNTAMKSSKISIMLD